MHTELVDVQTVQYIHKVAVGADVAGTSLRNAHHALVDADGTLRVRLVGADWNMQLLCCQQTCPQGADNSILGCVCGGRCCRVSSGSTQACLVLSQVYTACLAASKHPA